MISSWQCNNYMVSSIHDGKSPEKHREKGEGFSSLCKGIGLEKGQVSRFLLGNRI